MQPAGTYVYISISQTYLEKLCKEIVCHAGCNLNLTLVGSMQSSIYPNRLGGIDYSCHMRGHGSLYRSFSLVRSWHPRGQSARS